MKLDLKGFQKVSKEGNMTKLRHPQGHEISINHNILSPKMRGEIEALPQIDKEKPKFANAGVVAPSPQEFSESVSNAVNPSSTKTTPSKDAPPSSSAKSLDSGQSDEDAQKRAAIRKDMGYDKNGNQVSPYAEGGKIQHFADSGAPVDASGSISGSDSSLAQGIAKTAPNPTGNQDLSRYANKAKGGKIQKFAEKGEVEPEKDSFADMIGKARIADPKSDGSGVVPDQDVVASPTPPPPVPQGPQPASIPQSPPQNSLDDYVASHKNLTEAHATIGKALASQLPQQSQQPIQNQAQQQTAAQTPAPVDTSGLPANPSDMNAYQQQQGIEKSQEQNISNQGNIQGALGTQQGQAAGKAAEQDQLLYKTQMKNQKILDDEKQNIVADFENGHIDPHTGEAIPGSTGQNVIDPDRWKNSSANTGANRVKNMFGLILGGIGGSKTGTNVALDLINNQISRDIDAQKTNATNKMNLYGKMNESLNSDTASSGLLRSVLSEHYARQLEANAGKYANADAAAKANQAILSLRAQSAQGLVPIANLQTIKDMQNPGVKNGVTTGQTQPGQSNMQLSQIDPASVLKFTNAPPEIQDKMAEEIKDRADINNITPQILDAFDMGTSKNPVVAAQGRRAFEAAMNTTVKDKEGTARQAAFDSIHKNMSPNGITALPGEDAERRKSVITYLGSRGDAPISMAHGIDLDKFAKTARIKQPSPYQEGDTGKDKQGNPVVRQNGQWVRK